MKFKQSASRFALVGVFVAQTADGVRVAVTGAGRKGVFRVKAMDKLDMASTVVLAGGNIQVPQPGK